MGGNRDGAAKGSGKGKGGRGSSLAAASKTDALDKVRARLGVSNVVDKNAIALLKQKRPLTPDALASLGSRKKVLVTHDSDDEGGLDEGPASGAPASSAVVAASVPDDVASNAGSVRSKTSQYSTAIRKLLLIMLKRDICEAASTDIHAVHITYDVSPNRPGRA